MKSSTNFVLERDAIMLPYSRTVAEYCAPFCCNDEDLDEFFAEDAFHYEEELLGRTYAWIEAENPKNILGVVTLANDSIKAKNILPSARNRVQRSISNAKRGMNYPAVLIGRLAVSAAVQGCGLRVGSQILTFIKDWFRADNKTGCRFIVVDAYNNENTMNFYQQNGFKTLYKSEQEERDFLGLMADQVLDTRFMFFDLKK